MSENNKSTNRSLGYGTFGLFLVGALLVIVRMLGGRNQNEERPGFGDNLVLDQFTIPVGDWAEQIVRWVDTDMESKIGFDLLGMIEWPFGLLFSNFVKSGNDRWWEITDMPWWGVCALFFVIGSAFRNVKIGLFAASALALCGMLGIEYWDEVALTLGMVIVAVFLCAVIGIPLGVLCGRVDGVWNAVRPALDAMQVIHSFVYMLPFIFFFGIGFESSTMVTMIFAIPPLIRLTNLGIRQVPDDVVEASRAYGAPEWRVLLDVQLPLARPAIMTGLNQTLLLAISMLGIAALMGAGGLGLLVFRATNNLDVALGASAGIDLVLEVKPEQVTLVPDAPSAITSDSGWDCKKHADFLAEVITTFKKEGIRTSIFLDANPSMVEAAAKTGTDRIELYTEPYASKYLLNRKEAVKDFIATAKIAEQSGLGVNAGHDLSLENIAFFAKSIPNLLEVSIGHALICEAIYFGLDNVVNQYLHRLENP